MKFQKKKTVNSSVHLMLFHIKNSIAFRNGFVNRKILTESHVVVFLHFIAYTWTSFFSSSSPFFRLFPWQSAFLLQFSTVRVMLIFHIRTYIHIIDSPRVFFDKFCRFNELEIKIYANSSPFIKWLYRFYLPKNSKNSNSNIRHHHRYQNISMT